MAVSADYLTFVLDQLRRVLPNVRANGCSAASASTPTN